MNVDFSLLRDRCERDVYENICALPNETLSLVTQDIPLAFLKKHDLSAASIMSAVLNGQDEFLKSIVSFDPPSLFCALQTACRLRNVEIAKTLLDRYPQHSSKRHLFELLEAAMVQPDNLEICEMLFGQYDKTSREQSPCDSRFGIDLLPNAVRFNFEMCEPLIDLVVSKNVKIPASVFLCAIKVGRAIDFILMIPTAARETLLDETEREAAMLMPFFREDAVLFWKTCARLRKTFGVPKTQPGKYRNVVEFVTERRVPTTSKRLFYTSLAVLKRLSDPEAFANSIIIQVERNTWTHRPNETASLVVDLLEVCAGHSVVAAMVAEPGYWESFMDCLKNVPVNERVLKLLKRVLNNINDRDAFKRLFRPVKEYISKFPVDDHLKNSILEMKSK